jgi:hypothetical protein
MDERRLVAVSDGSAAPGLAVAYVDRLRPCYEWEGYHDCPEAEAVFAEEYQATHPRGRSATICHCSPRIAGFAPPRHMNTKDGPRMPHAAGAHTNA